MIYGDLHSASDVPADEGIAMNTNWRAVRCALRVSPKLVLVRNLMNEE